MLDALVDDPLDSEEVLPDKLALDEGPVVVEAVSTVVELAAEVLESDMGELETLSADEADCADAADVLAALEDELLACEFSAATNEAPATDEVPAFDETPLSDEVFALDEMLLLADVRESLLEAAFPEVWESAPVDADAATEAACEGIAPSDKADDAGGMMANDTAAPQNRAAQTTVVATEIGRRGARRCEGVVVCACVVRALAALRSSHQRRSAPERMGASTKRKERSETAKMMMICATRTHQGTSTVEVMRDVARMMG